MLNNTTSTQTKNRRMICGASIVGFHKEESSPCVNELPLPVEATKGTYCSSKCCLFRHITVCVPGKTFTYNESL